MTETDPTPPADTAATLLTRFNALRHGQGHRHGDPHRNHGCPAR